MTVAHRQAVSRSAAMAFLRSHAADTVPHVNGTLLDHLTATEGLLRSWGASEPLALAGLVHAAYGTDGFAPFLVPWQDRRPLARAVGPAVEEIVYLYASCDRASVYPQLSADGPVAFRDRFASRTFGLTAAQIGDFVDLTLANELEIALSAGTGARDPASAWIGPLVAQVETRARPAARHGAHQLLARLP